MQKNTPVDNLWKTILEIIFPKKCIGCNQIDKNFLCQNCQQKIQKIDYFFCPVCKQGSFEGYTHSFCQYRTSLKRVIAPFKYQGLIKEMIRQFKYCGIRELGEDFSKLIAEFLENRKIELSSDYILVAVPLHQDREKERGFNQAEKLAKSLSEKLSLQHNPRLLLRNRDTPSQIKLSKKERQNNVKGAFSINLDFTDSVKNKNFILVDDVFTTGATLNECAKVLKRLRAKEVWGMVVAKD